VGGSSGVIPERAEIHVGVALDDAARQGVGGGSGRLAAGPQVNAVAIRVVLRGRGKAGLPEIHLKIRMDSEQCPETAGACEERES
jgi:hypothetical protein